MLHIKLLPQAYMLQPSGSTAQIGGSEIHAEHGCEFQPTWRGFEIQSLYYKYLQSGSGMEYLQQIEHPFGN